MNITAIDIVECAFGPDTVLLTTDLPGSTYPFKGTKLVLKFHCAKGKAQEYCGQHFPAVPVTVVSTAQN